MISKLYYEGHITIEPVFDSQRELASLIAQKYNFKLAHLLMKKREADTEERSSKDTFMTSHSKVYEELVIRLTNCVNELKANNYKVWRYKIEDTLLDSKHNDELVLL